MKINWSKNYQNLNTQKDLAQILAKNNYQNDNPKFSDLSDPFLFKNMEKAVSRIFSAIKNQERIMIFGDFDADGITSTVILVSSLQKLGAKVSYRIPSRINDGHGLKNYLIEEIATKKVSLIITCDCGSNDFEEIIYAKKKGIDVIITDHHELDKSRFSQEAVAIINPKFSTNFQHFSGSAVAFKLVSALAKTKFSDDKKIREFLNPFLEIATIGIIADCVPLVSENHLIAKLGLAQMKNSSWQSLQEIWKFLHIDENFINEQTISFGLAPRLNSASRLGNVLKSTQLFLGDSQKTADCLNYLENLNEQRKIEVENSLKIAEKMIDRSQKCQVIFSRKFNAGVLGLIASSLVEKLGMPIIIMTEINGRINSSCRSLPGISMIKGVKTVSSNFLYFGGHNGAAGFVSDLENLEKIKTEFWDYFGNLKPVNISRELTGFVLPNFLTTEIFTVLDKFSPFGIENTEPIFAFENFILEEILELGSSGNHFRLVGKVGNEQVELVYFFAKNIKKIIIGETYKMAFTVSQNVWQGQIKIQLKVFDFLANSPNL